MPSRTQCICAQQASCPYFHVEQGLSRAGAGCRWMGHTCRQRRFREEQGYTNAIGIAHSNVSPGTTLCSTLCSSRTGHRMPLDHGRQARLVKWLPSAAVTRAQLASCPMADRPRCNALQYRIATS
jgi:hypothetical protein